MNMSVASSSVKKGETLIDTAMTLNAMRPDCWSSAIQAIRAPSRCWREGQLLGHQCRRRRSRAPDPGAARRADHPPRKGRLDGLTIAICGDILHSRVARSNIILLNKMENRGCA
jgi:aspartate carbamoyltransferase catalytic subunit